ncbi:glycosyltransferase [Archangium gephyra]|uniref:glycosyltransferase n=1 Tax=Archangium gephyra TaxID=48 RepID=UPI0035D4939F
MTPTSVVIVPCYNEARRLSLEGFEEFRQYPDVRLLLVDDGSTDDTRAVLEQLCERLDGQAQVLAQPKNGGKAEAVRAGMLAAYEAGAQQLGYLDADLATPPGEMCRLLTILRERNAAVVMGARVALLGTRIERRARRHYMGRVFATGASLILSLRVYDTQCGAKVFRRSELLRSVLSSPFSSRWAFDVELIGRLLVGTAEQSGLTPEDFVEVPLQTWQDIAQSKLKHSDVPKMGLDLLKIFVKLQALKRKARRE